MNPDRIVIEIMVKMRQSLPKSLADRRRPSHEGRLPLEILRDVCRRFGVDWAATYTLPLRTNTLLRNDLLGPPELWRDIRNEEDLLTIANLGDNALIPFEHKPNTRSPATKFGYLAIDRQGGFSSDEVAALKYVCDFAAGYIFEMTEAECLAALERARQLMISYDRTSSSGTQVLRLLNCLHRATRAHVSVYCTIHNKDICVEYKAIGSRGNKNRIPCIIENSIPDEVLSTLSRREVSVWSDLDDRPLTSFISTTIGWEPKSPLYVLGVQRIAGILIAVWILGFERGRFFLDHPYRELLVDTINNAQSLSVHLYQRRYRKLIVDPIFKSRDTRIDSQLLFALMPFKEAWSDRIWEKMIKPIAAENGLVSKRADDLFGRDIMEDIWSNILKARVVVADITSRNANVFYELGIAHTLGKPVVLLTQSVQDIPFDLNRYRHIIYADNLDGYEVLTKLLRKTLLEIISINGNITQPNI